MVVHKKKKNEQETSQQNSVSADGATYKVVTQPADDAFQSVVSSVDDYSIILLDQSGAVVSWNAGVGVIEGYEASEVMGKNCRIFHTPEDRERGLAEEMIDEANRNGRVYREGWNVRKDGTRYWAATTITAVRYAPGDLRGYLRVTRDMSATKEVLDAYHNAVEELTFRNQALETSSSRYRRMFEEVVDYAIILLDPQGVVLDWNQGAQTLKGYAPEEVLGKNFRNFYPADERREGLPERLLQDALAQGRCTYEGWRLRKDGTRFWGIVTITALHDEAGAVIGFTEVTGDLTHRKRLEDQALNVVEELRQANEQLAMSRELYHRMVAEVQDYAIILLDQYGNIQNWNVGAEYIKGYKASEVIGKSLSIFYSKEDQKRKLPQKLLGIAAREGKASHEGWRVRSDGSRFWGSVVITALHDADGQVIGFSKVTRDLTERKEAEDMLRANAAQLDLKNKALERLNEELSSFSHVASHDLKEPLRKIRTYISRIEDYQFNPEKTRDLLERVKDSATNMHNLISDLLAYSQVSNDQSVFEKVDLNKIVAAVRFDLEVAINEKQVNFTIDRLPVVRGVRYQLHQLFLNLLSNAVKFSKPGIQPDIRISCERIAGPDLPGDPVSGSNKYFHIAVSDNGIGFDHQHSSRIFDPFQRLHARSAYAGTGIGLAIVKRIIDNHAGIISAESSPGQGATFHVYLPS